MAARVGLVKTSERPRLRWHGALLAGAIIALVVSALLVQGKHVSSIERGLFRIANDTPSFFETPTWQVMQLGNGIMILIAPLVAIVCRRYRLAIILAAASGAAYLLARVAKDIVSRPRPAGLLHNVHLRPGSTAAGNGYPSGHAAVAFALATVLCLMIGPKLRSHAVALILAGAGIVGFARVYVGAHFPLDVVGGAALGIIVGIAAVTASHFFETPEKRNRRLWQ